MQSDAYLVASAVENLQYIKPVEPTPVKIVLSLTEQKQLIQSIKMELYEDTREKHIKSKISSNDAYITQLLAQLVEKVVNFHQWFTNADISDIIESYKPT